MDTATNNYLVVQDFRKFIHTARLNAVENDLNLLFERFDISKRGKVGYEEFLAAITPFE